MHTPSYDVAMDDAAKYLGVENFGLNPLELNIMAGDDGTETFEECAQRMRALQRDAGITVGGLRAEAELAHAAISDVSVRVRF